MKGYVYLICDPSQETYKIGCTRNIAQKRLKSLQVGNPTKLHIVDTFQTDYPFRLETMLHKKYSGKQAINEWFNLDQYDVSNFQQTCQQYQTIINSLVDNPHFNKGGIK